MARIWGLLPTASLNLSWEYAIFEAELSAPAQLSGDCAPGQHTNWNLRWYILWPDHLAKPAPGFLTPRDHIR